ncbi:MAG: D-alanine--D-alanine ligase family protein [Puniceicoccales bacterium]
MSREHVTVLCGGDSPEADVSRVTGRSVAGALGAFFDVELIDLPHDHLPEALDPAHTVVFPAMHGPFGEDGQLQSLLEARGFAYVGCDAAASSLCMDKARTKAAVAESGFYFARQTLFATQSKPDAAELIAELGEAVVLKPVNMGSSVGVHIVRGQSAVSQCLSGLEDGQWMAETLIAGREMTIGLLDGEAMGIVEICPRDGVYDFEHKYTAGSTEYVFPAPINETLECKVKTFAANAFTACACRDFARLDFIVTSDEQPYFLEINTIPGMTPTSLLPKSASCSGLNFAELVHRMTIPAIKRARALRTLT